MGEIENIGGKNGAEPAGGWDVFDRLLAEVQSDLSSYRECGDAERILTHLRAARDGFDRVEREVQASHLACCVLPGLESPGEVTLALTRLSAQRVGALIVVERQQCLDEYIARGTRLDAHVSSGLLESLFYPGNALHDGAVIIRGTRIMAAGVFLPLAAERRDATHGRFLGARHRAALGLSRLSDALVFVVSEETGQIAVVLRGLLHPAVHVNLMTPPPQEFDPERGRPGADRLPDRSVSDAPRTWLRRLWRRSEGRGAR